MKAPLSRCSKISARSEEARELEDWFLQGWAKLPIDVIRQVVDKLSTKEAWSARRISSSWAQAVRQTAHFEIDVSTTCAAVLSKTRLIHQQQLPHRYPKLKFTLTFTTTLTELAKVLLELSSQATYLTPLKLVINLLVTDNHSSQHLITCAADIVSRATVLQNCVDVVISLCTPADNPIAPSPALLLQLAPVLSSIDLLIPMQQMPPGDLSYWRQAPFTPAHITALYGATSLRTLCVSDKRYGGAEVALEDSIPTIAQFRSLTKLHLTLAASNTQPDFQSLSQLTTLEDLALRCSRPFCCADVLSASRDNLHDVILASAGFSSATNRALADLPALDRLAIKLWCLSDTQAASFCCLTARSISLELFDFCYVLDNALMVWAMVCPVMQVRELTLWSVTDSSISLLRAMPGLHSLHIADSSTFTGRSLCCQPSVTEISLTDCPAVGSGLQHMLGTALPQLQKLAIQTSIHTFDGVAVSQEMIQALRYGECLTVVDLRGVSGLALHHFAELKAALSRPHRTGPPIIVQLPHNTLGRHQSVVLANDNLYLPSLYLLPGHDRYLDLDKKLHGHADIFDVIESCCRAYSWFYLIYLGCEQIEKRRFKRLLG